MVCCLLNVDKEVACLQQSVTLFTEYGEHLPFFIKLAYFFLCCTRLCNYLLVPFKFLLLLKAVTGSFWKIYLNDLFTDKMFQYLRKTLLILVSDWLYVDASGIFVSFEVALSLFFKSSFLFIFFTVFICLVINSSLQSWLTNLCLSFWQYWLKLFGVMQIRLILSAWLYVILSFSDLECTWRKFWRSVLFR